MIVDEPPPAVGISSSEYARRTGKLISLITELRAHGADAFIDLPRIAVIGNQSAGKSSVVEAISGITLPRASGTCTRCPMECRLKHHDGPWQCQLRLRRDAQESSTKSKEQDFGPTIFDKLELVEMIRRAQLAVLNPEVSAAFFEMFDTTQLQPGDLPPGSSRQLQFSSDVVCLDISGPDVTDLAFIDLPGIISYVAQGQDRGNIEAVKNMVKTHIANENTLILLTITMRDDIDNQGAADLAHLADPTGSRTIGVLTKPDTVLRGEHANWLRVLDGVSHPLKLGYFVTKQPSPEELEEDLSFFTVRERETFFFAETSPWKDRTDLHPRFGTPKLTQELSKVLGMLISKALPGLRERCKDALQSVRNDLEKLPAPPSDQPAAELLRVVTTLSTDIERLVRGSDNFEVLLQKCRPAYQTFKSDVRRTWPQLCPFYDWDDMNNKNYTATEFEMNPAEYAGPADSEPVFLKDVRAHIQKSLTRELPYNVPFKAKVSLIRRFSESWLFFSSQCLASIHEATVEELKRLVDARFGKFALTGLSDKVHAIVETQVELSQAVTQQRIQWMLELEDPPFTLNDHYFSTYRDKYLYKYKEARQTQTTRIESDGSEEDAIKNIISAFLRAGRQVTEEELGKLLGPDPFDEELIVMAETAAYFHVSYKRIIDNIPRIIDHDFLHSITKEIQGRLIQELELGTERATEQAGMYLAEDEQVGLERQHLQRKKERLDAVQAKFWGFGG